MRSSLRAALGSRTMVPIVCAAVVAIAYWPLGRALWQVVTLEGVHQSSDSHTHLLRALMARDYFLPSGHHWGWDPFWFQGYVPFLLYAHLMYVGLAVASAALGLDLAPTLNAFAVAVLVALPLIGGWVVSRRAGIASAALCAAWLASLNSDYGGGPQGMFHYGLLTQQAGLCAFVPFVHALVGRLDLRRAGLWLGVLALVHQHTFIVGTIVWGIAGLGVAAVPAPGKSRSASVGAWVAATALALLVAAPTLLGLWYGLDNRGAFTGFAQPPFYEHLMKGMLVAPWPTLAAVAVAVLGAAWAVRTSADAGRFAVWVTIGAVLTALSLQFVTTGIDVLDPMLRYVLRLRTLSYAACFWAVLAAVRFGSIPPVARATAAALTVAGLVVGWGHHETLARRMHYVHGSGRPTLPPSSRAYAQLLNDLRSDVGTRTSTIALVAHPKPTFRHPFQRLMHVVRQPALAGHGVELSAVRNADLVFKLRDLPCPELRRQVRAHAVGYVVGSGEEAYAHVRACLAFHRTLRRREWWAVPTGIGWHNFDPRVRSFARDSTWTTLRWSMRPRPHPIRLRLPMAATAPWRATVDGRPAVVERGRERLATLNVPAGGREVVLEYAGYRGEWLSVILSAAALLAGTLRTKRSRARASSLAPALPART